MLRAAAVLPVILVPAASASASGAQPFTFLAAGFTQSLYATDLPPFGGVAFAPTGDPLIAAGGGAYRVSSSATVTQNGSTIHPVIGLPGPDSPESAGLANSRDGGLYANNLLEGVVKVDPTTGGIVAGRYGAAGNGLGITLDPQTGHLVYGGYDGQVQWVSPDFTSQGTFSTQAVNAGEVAFDPTGGYLFTSNHTLTILDRDNHVVQTIPLAGGACCARGIAFHAADPKFVISNNTDGTITRYDFPNDDYTRPPTQSLLASGGFRGITLQVGGNGCAYLFQAGTRFDDGTVTSAGSLVRLCAGFAPPAQQADTDLAITDVSANLNVNATSPRGAAVTFTLPGATDEDKTAPVVTCDHASGSTFPIGTTTVTCTASDADDSPSTATGRFTIRVKGAAAQLADLLAFDQGLRPGHAFRDMTQAGINDVKTGDVAGACGELRGIIALAGAQRGKAITPSQTTTIITDATRIRSVLGC